MSTQNKRNQEARRTVTATGTDKTPVNPMEELQAILVAHSEPNYTQILGLILAHTKPTEGDAKVTWDVFVDQMRAFIPKPNAAVSTGTRLRRFYSIKVFGDAIAKFSKMGWEDIEYAAQKLFSIGVRPAEIEIKELTEGKNFGHIWEFSIPRVQRLEMMKTAGIRLAEELNLLPKIEEARKVPDLPAAAKSEDRPGEVKVLVQDGVVVNGEALLPALTRATPIGEEEYKEQVVQDAEEAMGQSV